MNIWTHFLGAIISTALLWQMSGVHAALSAYSEHIRSSGIWNTPLMSSQYKATLTWHDFVGFTVFLVGCAFCFACSAAFHMSLCHSKNVSLALLLLSFAFSHMSGSGRSRYESHRLSRYAYTFRTGCCFDLTEVLK